jgi:hypothetical protein
MLDDVLDDRIRHNIAERQVPFPHQPYLGTRNIVLWSQHISNCQIRQKWGMGEDIQ